MADQLKSFFSPSLVRRLAADIERGISSFPSRLFLRETRDERARPPRAPRSRQTHYARARAHLPPTYPDAIDILLRSLGPEHATDELLGVGMAPFYYFPHTLFVADRGLDHFELSMRAQYELTKRFSAESSIRPFIAQHPERTFALLRPVDARRERPRSAARVRGNAPAPSVGTTARHGSTPTRSESSSCWSCSKDDPATLVRRSVANNLNDLGKVHPDCSREPLPRGSTRRRGAARAGRACVA